MEFKLSNPLLIKNVKQRLTQVAKLIKASDTLNLDVSEVVNIDSAGIALLVEIKALSAANKCQLTFLHPSAPVLKFCQLYQITL